MGNGVDTRCGGKALGCGHVEVGINYSHVRHELIIGKGILNAGLLIGDNCKGSDLRAGTCRSGHCDEADS